MNLIEVLEEYELAERRRRGSEVTYLPVAVAALRDYLHMELGDLEHSELPAETLYSFLLDHYPREEEPDEAVALILLEVAAGVARHAVARGLRTPAPFLTAVARLREDLPRTIRAYRALREQVRPEAPAGRIAVVRGGNEGEDSELPEEEEPNPAQLSAGVDRLAHLDRVDYAAAEDGYYTVLGLSSETMTVQSETRRALGEPPVRVRLPAELAPPGDLREGDTVHAEIAPAEGYWELLDVFAVRPGGYG